MNMNYSLESDQESAFKVAIHFPMLQYTLICLKSDKKLFLIDEHKS